MNTLPTMVIIRHSERIDEVSPKEWLRFVDAKYNEPNECLRDYDSFRADPPISNEVGKNYAIDAAKTLLNYLNENESQFNVPSKNIRFRIYSSKLLRCVQTAAHISRILQSKDIFMSKGLALTAAAVEERHSKNNHSGPQFDFLSIEEIQTTVGDDLRAIDIDNIIRFDNWYHALKDIVHLKHGNHHIQYHQQHHHTQDHGSEIDHNESNYGTALQVLNNTDHDSDIHYIDVVVAHRETIRNLLGYHKRLPYCAIGFVYDNEECAKVGNLAVMKLLAPNGDEIKF